jgi:hypothetical protein
MLYNIIQSNDYKDLTSKQVKELLHFLQNNNEEFDVTANVDGMSFNPPLPEPIKEQFVQFTLFSLANYTYQSLIIEDDYITFEAGFGEENFGSICKVPLFAIFQISINNSILFVNPCATVEKYFVEDIDEEEQRKRSMNAFKLNK